MNTRTKIILMLFALLCGVGLTGAVLQVFAGPAAVTAETWPLEGDKPGQASIWGRYPQGDFGWALAVGDLNGDDYDDLIANARSAPGGTEAEGEVYVIPGPLAFHETYTMPQQAALIFQGGSGDDTQLGTDLDTGDINGDGYDDLVMGSWITSDAYVYLGSADIQSSSPQTVTATPENMALTVSPADASLFCDFNGDGFEDLFVEHFSIEDVFEVKVWGVLGSEAITMTDPASLIMPADADVIVEGFHPTEWHSPIQKNMACGDIDGDSVPDLTIGIFGESPPYRNGAGMVYVVPGDPEISAGNPVTLTMPTDAGAIIEGVDGRMGSSGDHLGESLLSADFNRDGRADLLLGAPGASGPDNIYQYAGEVYLWLGRALEGQRFKISDQASWTVFGQVFNDRLGSAMAPGDFDRDGYAEIILGCASCGWEEAPPWIYGRGYVLEPLKISGFIPVTDVSRLTILPYDDAPCIGMSVSAMDLEGNGTTDLVISAPCTDNPEGNLPGTVYVVSYPADFNRYLPLVSK